MPVSVHHANAVANRFLHLQRSVPKRTSTTCLPYESNLARPGLNRGDALAVPIAPGPRRDAEIAARKARRDSAKESVWLRNGQADRTRRRPMPGLDGHLLPPGKYPP